MSLCSPSGIPFLVLLQCSTDSRVRWSMEQQSVINKEEKHHEDWRWDHGSSRRPPTEKKKTKRKRKSVLASFSFLLDWPLNHKVISFQILSFTGQLLSRTWHDQWSESFQLLVLIKYINKTQLSAALSLPLMKWCLKQLMK